MVVIVVVGVLSWQRVLLLLVVLHVRGEGCRSVIAPIADGALKGFAVVVRLHVNLKVIAEGAK